MSLLEQEKFYSKAELIPLIISQKIAEYKKPIDHLYFPIDGFISIYEATHGHPLLEVGMIGREGMLGEEVILGAKKHNFGGIIQGPGEAWKISTQDFKSLIAISTELREITKSYLAVRLQQLGLSIACEHFHEIRARLAKWLVMSQDRAQSSTFHMTHEFIALMLGVRRVGVSIIANDFKKNGLIDYTRGQVKVIDRVALRAQACQCYKDNKSIYSSYFRLKYPSY